MKTKEPNTNELNQYRIKFIYIDTPLNIHERHFMAYSKQEVESMLPKITDSNLRDNNNEYELLSIEKFNRFADKWEEQ
tara:strand:+ start:133 stop:366 length:234 start_codon:yes stop_codon:yes gene_type:complete